jgi:hypothetical protein
VNTSTKVALGLLGVGAAAGAVALAMRIQKKGSLGAALGRTPERIGVLQDAVWDAIRNPQLRELALGITGNRKATVTVGRSTFNVMGARCEARDATCEAEAVGRWVAQNPQLAERFVPCGADSGVGALCSLLTLNGLACRLRLAPEAGGARVLAMVGMPKNTPSRWLELGDGRLRESSRSNGAEDYDG